jgi:hypothetical protein
MSMSDKLKSRKLWVLIVLVVLVVCNYRFGLGMPPGDVFYLVILGASYILGQGYVDAKQQPVPEFPTNDVIQSVSNIIQAEVGKLDLKKDIPIEKFIEALTPILKEEFQKLNSTTSGSIVSPITVKNVST